MQLNIERKPVQGIDGQNKIHQTIKHKDIGHIAYILSAKLYSDPVLAVVREYICNGTDAHVECGKKDLPVRVHAPTELEPYFSVRDFGKGITFEQMQDMYIHLGDSSKRESNEGIGCFGIGNMAFRAYTDGMTVTSRCQGEKTVYSLQVGEDNKVFAVVLSKSTLPKMEKTGVEISIAVKNSDVSEFRKKIAFFGKFMEVKPQTSLEIDELSVAVESKNKDWFLQEQEQRNNYWHKTSKDSYIVMGGCPYRINDNFEGITDKQKAVVSDGIIIKVPLGSVGITPDREKLEYSPETIRFLKRKLNEIYQELLSKVQEDLDKEKSYYNFVLKMDQLSTFNCISLSDVKFNGDKVYPKLGPIKDPNNPLKNAILHQGVIKTIYEHRSNDISVRTPTNSWTKEVTISKKSCVVIDDAKSGINARIKTIHKELGYQNFYVVKTTEDGYKHFKKRYHLDTWTEGLLKSADFVPMPTKGSSRGGTGTRSDVKAFSLDWNQFGYGRGGETAFWKDAEEIPETETKYYFPISRYKIAEGEKTYNLSEFRNGASCGLKQIFPNVYGIRQNDVKKLDSTWKNIFEEIDNNWENLIEGEILNSFHGVFRFEKIYRDWKFPTNFCNMLKKYPSLENIISTVRKEKDYSRSASDNFVYLMASISRTDITQSISEKVESFMQKTKGYKCSNFLKEHCALLVHFLDDNYRYSWQTRELTPNEINDINDYMKNKEPKAKEIV